MILAMTSLGNHTSWLLCHYRLLSGIDYFASLFLCWRCSLGLHTGWACALLLSTELHVQPPFLLSQHHPLPPSNCSYSPRFFQPWPLYLPLMTSSCGFRCPLIVSHLSLRLGPVLVLVLDSTRLFESHTLWGKSQIRYCFFSHSLFSYCCHSYCSYSRLKLLNGVWVSPFILSL